MDGAGTGGGKYFKTLGLNRLTTHFTESVGTGGNFFEGSFDILERSLECRDRSVTLAPCFDGVSSTVLVTFF